VIVVKEGETIPKEIPQKVLDSLVELGSAGEPKAVEVVPDEQVVEENAALKAEIEALKKQLADAEAAKTGAGDGSKAPTK
jgi:polyhydroxyalkanoate synthesis regulator phasin